MAEGCLSVDDSVLIKVSVSSGLLTVCRYPFIFLGGEKHCESKVIARVTSVSHDVRLLFFFLGTVRL